MNLRINVNPHQSFSQGADTRVSTSSSVHCDYFVFELTGNHLHDCDVIYKDSEVNWLPKLRQIFLEKVTEATVLRLD